MRSRQLTAPITYLPGPPAQRRSAVTSRGADQSFAALLIAERLRARRTSAAAATPVRSSVAAGDGMGAAIVSAARGQLGGAYVWGGERPGAFDCSGLARWAVRQATGQTLPRTAAEQARVGQPVARADLQPGDLVFFSNTNGPGVSHVGVYAGDGQFIHAASEEQGIIVSRLDEPYWASHYTSARRVQSA